MKRNALLAFGLLVSLVSAGAVVGKEVKNVGNVSVVKNADITVDEARKKALAKVPGEIEDEYTLEDEDGNTTSFVFVIKASENGKKFDVQIDPQNGNVLAADQQQEETESREEEEEEEETTESEETQETTETESEKPTEPVESTNTDSNVSEDDETDEVSMNNDDDKAPNVKITMEQARAKAIKKAKGKVQNEALVTDDGNAYYTFTIKGKKDKMTEIRVDANSGKAKKFKNRVAKSE